jgi:tRNA(Ile)-lysidine synthase
MKTDDFIQHVREHIAAESLFAPGDAVVVAVSGGRDSIALLHVLHDLGEDGRLPIRLHVGHLDHGLRGDDGEADAAFVADACRKLNVPCTCDHENVLEIVRHTGGSVEQRAREVRYQFLERLCRDTGSTVIATAHHADDQAETILHRIARGTGLRGLSGIAPKRPLGKDAQPTLVRPLLSIRRKQIIAFLNHRNIHFRQDPTNDTDNYTRNRIRGSILPAIEERVHPQAVQAILRLGEQAGLTYAFLHDTADKAFDHIVVHQQTDEIILDADRLAEHPRIIQTEIIRLALLGLRAGERNLSWADLKQIVEMAVARTDSRTTQLPDGIRLHKENRRLRFRLVPPDESPALFPQTELAIPGQADLPTAELTLSATLNGAVGPSSVDGWKCEKSKWQERLDLDRIRPPLLIRSRMEGDRFRPLGATGSKTLGDFLTDQKVDPTQRDRIPILCDQAGPLWVIPYRIDDRARITERTRRTVTLRAQPW